MDSPVLLDAGVVNRCRRRVHLEHDALALRPVGPIDPTAEQRSTDAVAHRRAVADELSHLFGEQWAEVPAELPHAERVAMTRALLDSRAPVIWGGRLPVDPAGGRRGGADLLIASRTGYLPVIVVRHKVTDPGSGARTAPLSDPGPGRARHDPHRRVRAQPRDQLRLAHALRLLQAAGVAAPGRARGGVIGLDADVVVWHDLDAPTWPDGRTAMSEYDTRFADRLAVAHAAATDAEPLARPSRVNECRTCPWWPTCGEALRQERDVSLVLRGEDAVALRAAGVATVDDLAALDRSADSPVPLVGMSVADAVLLARAWQRGLSLVRRKPDVTVPRADVEVDIDMESFGDAGAYLWGCLLTGADVGVPPGYRAFATWEAVPTPEEGYSFAEFWSWLSDVRSRAAQRGLRFAAYCYNELAENRWMLSSAERFAAVPGVPSVAAVQEFIDSSQWIDLFGVVSDEFLCAHGKGLKTVAPAAGFAWHDPDAGGENSMRWYRNAVGLDGAEPDPAQQERLLTYNADDVRATCTLRRWMSSEAVRQVPFADDL